VKPSGADDDITDRHDFGVVSAATVAVSVVEPREPRAKHVQQSIVAHSRRFRVAIARRARAYGERTHRTDDERRDAHRGARRRRHLTPRAAPNATPNVVRSDDIVEHARDGVDVRHRPGVAPGDKARDEKEWS
jgi:hypothetical protein